MDDTFKVLFSSAENMHEYMHVYVLRDVLVLKPCSKESLLSSKFKKHGGNWIIAFVVFLKFALLGDNNVLLQLVADGETSTFKLQALDKPRYEKFVQKLGEVIENAKKALQTKSIELDNEIVDIAVQRKTSKEQIATKTAESTTIHEEMVALNIQTEMKKMQIAQLEAELLRVSFIGLIIFKVQTKLATSKVERQQMQDRMEHLTTRKQTCDQQIIQMEDVFSKQESNYGKALLNDKEAFYQVFKDAVRSFSHLIYICKASTCHVGTTITTANNCCHCGSFTTKASQETRFAITKRISQTNQECVQRILCLCHRKSCTNR